MRVFHYNLSVYNIDRILPSMPPSVLSMGFSPKSSLYWSSYSRWLDLSAMALAPPSASSSRLEADTPMMSTSNALSSRIISRSSMPKSAAQQKCVSSVQTYDSVQKHECWKERFLPKSLSCSRVRLPTSSLMVISSTLLWFKLNCWAMSISLYKTHNSKVKLILYLYHYPLSYFICVPIRSRVIGVCQSSSLKTILQFKRRRSKDSL